MKRLFLLVCWSLAVGALGAELDGHVLPDSVSLGSEKLVLNGMGLRTATIFKVRVYVAGLYLKSKTSDTPAILASPSSKQLRMQFLRDVSATDIRSAWDHSFEENCEVACEQGKKSLQRLKDAMADMKKDDRMTYTFSGDTVEIAINDQKKERIADKEFVRTLLSTWIGKHPPTEGLKNGILGIKE